jgi:hypothetical protein
LRQIEAAIAERRDAEEQLKQSYIEWQTKALGTLLSALSPNPKGGKAMMEVVGDLTMRGEPSRKPGAAKIEDDDLEWHERGSPVAEDRNHPGSFERMLKGLQSGG